MKAHSTDGLNFVPKLAHASLPSSRSCIHSTRYSPSASLFPKTAVFHHGNYEGDLSMFGQRGASKNSLGRRVQLIETDSDTEYKRVLDTYQPPPPPPPPPPSPSPPQLPKNQLMRLCTHYRGRLLTPARCAQLTVWREQLCTNYYYQKSGELLLFGTGLVVWLLRLMLLGLLRFGKWSHVVCKGRVLLRNAARSLLWWMTLAKCGDATHFAMMLLGAPLLFVVAVLGFVLSMYCELKQWLSRSGYLDA